MNVPLRPPVLSVAALTRFHIPAGCIDTTPEGAKQKPAGFVQFGPFEAYAGGMPERANRARRTPQVWFEGEVD